MPVLTGTARNRALVLGRELNMWNIIRDNRAYSMHSQTFQNSPMAFQSAYLCGLAQIDRCRRALRELLFTTLTDLN